MTGAGNDASWSERAGPIALQIALATFGILALELALIRWASGQVRAFAYFSNLILIAAFLGMGLGLVLGRRRPGLVHWTLPSLAVLAIAFGFSESLGLVRLRFPDPSVHMWGSETTASALVLVVNLGIFLALIAAIVLIFLFAGSAVGHLFGRLPALTAYRWDLAGSLLGVIAVTIVTSQRAGPLAWLTLGVLPFVWLSRRGLSIAAAVVVLALAYYSSGDAVFSPYNRIDLRGEGNQYRLEVNRDFHQYMHDLSDAGINASPNPDSARVLRHTYDLPFVINARKGSAVVVGAGTGNDVQAALRHGYGRVLSVDIDPRIIELGEKLHPERPYADPRVVPVVDDARAFFQSGTGERFDAVVYGLLDSHAMFTALSTLRLDNYVYTEEGIRAAWNHVAPEGHLSISFSVYGGQWIADRLYWTIARATGQEPIAVYHGMHYGCTFIVPGPAARLDVRRINFNRFVASAPLEQVRTTSDDWPFLYVRPGVFPWGYVIVLSVLLIAATIATRRAFGAEALRADFDPVLFFMGAAFLLIETRGVTALSLLFGSTWLVNSAVFSGVLLMAFAGNEAVARLKPARVLPWFAALLVAVLIVWALPPSTLVGLPLVTRGVIGGVVNGLPIGFAGVIVSILLLRSRNPAASLGSNLLGSVVGGCLEYLSMVVGLRALALLAFALYLAALLFLMRREAAPAAT